MDIAAWLQRSRPREIRAGIRANAIDARVPHSLTVEDLKDPGLTLVGHRRRQLDAIAALGAEGSAAAVTAAPRDASTPADERYYVL